MKCWRFINRPQALPILLLQKHLKANWKGCVPYSNFLATLFVKYPADDLQWGTSRLHVETVETTRRSAKQFNTKMKLNTGIIRYRRIKMSCSVLSTATLSPLDKGIWKRITKLSGNSSALKELPSDWLHLKCNGLKNMGESQERYVCTISQ